MLNGTAPLQELHIQRDEAHTVCIYASPGNTAAVCRISEAASVAKFATVLTRGI